MVTVVGLVMLWQARARIAALVLGRVALALGVAVTVIGGLLVSYGVAVAAGPDEPITRELLPGVEYERFGHETAVVHLVTIDLADPCVVPAASRVAADGTAEALKTITWAEREAMAVAINGSFFYPYDQSPFWDVKPREGDVVTVLGPTVFSESDATGAAVTVSVGETDWAGQTLSITSDGYASVDGTVAADAATAVTGRHRLIQDGRVVAPGSVPYARTVVGIDEAGTTMWWLVVDGKQPGYSTGLSLSDAAAILRERGAHDAMELDGGGSSILVARAGGGSDAGVERLSRPMEIRIPGRSRVVGNHLGLRMPTTPGC